MVGVRARLVSSRAILQNPSGTVLANVTNESHSDEICVPRRQFTTEFVGYCRGMSFWTLRSTFDDG